MYKIYGLINSKTGELFYVGSTKQRYLCKRKCQHVEKARFRNSKKDKYIRKCGFEIHYVLLEKVEEGVEHFEREQFYIDTLKPITNTSGAKPVPPPMAGWNKKLFSKKTISKLGTMPDYKLARFLKVDKSTIARVRKENGIKSYAETTGNNGKIKKGEPHRRWTKNKKD